MTNAGMAGRTHTKTARKRMKAAQQARRARERAGGSPTVYQEMEQALDGVAARTDPAVVTLAVAARRMTRFAQGKVRC